MSIFQDNSHASRTEFVGWCIGLVIEAQIDWHNVWLPRIAMHRLCFVYNNVVECCCSLRRICLLLTSVVSYW